MKLDRRKFVGLGMAATGGLARRSFAAKPDNSPPHFVLVHPELFAASGGQFNCWADFDNDGDLDLFVGFKADLRIVSTPGPLVIRLLAPMPSERRIESPRTSFLITKISLLESDPEPAGRHVVDRD